MMYNDSIDFGNKAANLGVTALVAGIEGQDIFVLWGVPASSGCSHTAPHAPGPSQCCSFDGLIPGSSSVWSRSRLSHSALCWLRSPVISSTEPSALLRTSWKEHAAAPSFESSHLGAPKSGWCLCLPLKNGPIHKRKLKLVVFPFLNL